MRNKTLIIALCVVIALFAVSQKKTANAAEYSDYLYDYSEVFNPEQPSDICAGSAFLCDFDSGTVIYSKNENERKPIASMTKIMLLILAFEKEYAGELSFDEKIIVGPNAAGMGGSQVFLEDGGEYPISELIKSIIVSSANDSSVAIAERLYGSESVAVDEMNKKAVQLGLKNTLFSNCTGLTKPTQYSCAKDVAVMLSELVKYDKYFDYSKIYLDEIEHSHERKTQITNTNKLIKYYNGCDGGKTGFTNEAGFCLAATAKRGNTRLISVVIGEKDSKVRFADVSKLFNYGFDNYISKCILSSTNSEYSFEIKNGKQNYADALPEKDICIFGLKNKKENVRIVFDSFENSAPIKKGDVIGRFIVYENDIKIREYDAVSSCAIDRLGYSDYIKKIAEL